MLYFTGTGGIKDTELSENMIKKLYKLGDTANAHKLKQRFKIAQEQYAKKTFTTRKRTQSSPATLLLKPPTLTKPALTLALPPVVSEYIAQSVSTHIPTEILENLLTTARYEISKNKTHGWKKANKAYKKYFDNCSSPKADACYEYALLILEGHQAENETKDAPYYLQLAAAEGHEQAKLTMPNF